VRLRAVGNAVEERVEDDRHDGAEQDAGLEQRPQLVRQADEEVGGHHLMPHVILFLRTIGVIAPRVLFLIVAVELLAKARSVQLANVG